MRRSRSTRAAKPRKIVLSSLAFYVPALTLFCPVLPDIRKIINRLRLFIAESLVLLIMIKVKMGMDYWRNNIQRENRDTCRNPCPAANLSKILR
jgi:hypothetical protein